MSRRKIVSESDLSQGCEPKFTKDMIGKIYERLTIISYAGYYIQPSGNKAYYMWCKCSCGKTILGNTTHIRYGNWVSCGCKRNELSLARRLKHGEAPLHGKRSKIYSTWKSMHARCSNNKDAARKYCERGIKVCEGWSGENGFLNFKKDMYPPTDISIDRIDNKLHYSCGKCDECIKNEWKLNCRWASYLIQSNNRSEFNNYIMIGDKKMTYREADRFLGFPLKTIQGRKDLGWTDEQSISIPIKQGKRRPLSI